MLEWMKVNDWSWSWLRAMAKNAYLWLADPENPKRHKKRFGPFFLHWCNKAIKISREEERQAKLMSAEREQQYYKDKQRGGSITGGGFKKIGDL